MSKQAASQAGEDGVQTMNKKEKDIRKQIQDYLRWTGWFVYYNLAGLGAYPGLSDLVAVKNGRVVFIEVKKPTGRQSKKQKEFQADLEAAGGEYLLARGVEDVEHLGGKKQLRIDTAKVKVKKEIWR